MLKRPVPLHCATASITTAVLVVLSTACGERVVPGPAEPPPPTAGSRGEPQVEPKGAVEIATPGKPDNATRIADLIQTLGAEDSSGDRAVDELAGHAAAAIDPLVAALRGRPVSRLHMRAATVLARLGDAAQPQVVALTRDSDPLLRLTAVQALAEIEKPGPEVLAALRDASRDSNAKVRVLAQAVLQRNSPPPPPEVPVLPPPNNHKE